MNDLTSDPMLPAPFAIRRIRKETEDTFTIEIEPQNGVRGNGAGKLTFAPGQFNMLYVFGVGEVPISISGNPKHPEKLLHTIRAVGAVTKAIQKMKPGTILGVRGPFGTCW
ncbi:MAG: Ni/Fe hydrogenase subunit gamma, partial [Candidatus Omnitrophica bacterium]|nr:Ni/Fe hydrogenase subunit gamma [Candidatus Omnitrophota bacterium]